MTSTVTTPTQIGSGLAALRELRVTDSLESAVADLPSILADVAEHDELAAARLLASFAPAEVEQKFAARRVGISVVGSTTVRGAVGALAFQLLRHGLVPDVVVGDFGRWSFELRDRTAPVFDHEPDLTLCLLDASIVTDRLSVPWTVDDLIATLDDVYGDLVEGIAAHGEARTLVVNTVPLPPRLLAMLVDLDSRAQAIAAWRRFNADLAETALDHPRVHVLDAESILCGTGPLADERLATYARIELGEHFLAEVARQVGHIVRSARGMTRKCLAIDLDGTMWGGVVADTGPAGLVLRDGPRGEAFSAAQDTVRQLAAQGVLVVVLSKNDDDVAREVFETDDRMRLAESDLVALVANWDPKPHNLGRIAEELNLGTDAFVFIDDSASECGLMRLSRPEVEVVQVDADEPALHVPRLLRDGWFTTARVTDEDRARPERYRQESRRHALRATTGSVGDYLAALDTTVTVQVSPVAAIPRLAQITQRTNQFNLTTIRMDEADVAAWIEHPDRSVVAVQCSDRFGDHGLVGCLFLEQAAGELHIRNFALSCRVLARGVEAAVLGYVVDTAQASGARQVVGWYRPTAKNRRVADLYPDHGFTAHPVDETGEHRFTFVPGEEMPPASPVRMIRKDVTS